MSARLQPGYKSINLTIDRPIERLIIDVPEYRNDIVGVKVWCSATPGFTPDDTNLVFDGLSMSITISALTDGSPLNSNTLYYVKYALISEIDTSYIHPVSEALSAQPIDIYIADLTNDTAVVPTDSSGNNGVYTNAYTTMNIYNLGVQETTGWTYYVKTVSNIEYKDADDISSRAGTGIVNGLITAFPLYITNLTQDLGYVEIEAYNSSTDTYLSKIFRISKVYSGVDGETVIIVSLSVNTPVIYKDSSAYSVSGTFTPLKFYSTITVGAQPPYYSGDHFYTITGINSNGVEDTESTIATSLPITGVTFTPDPSSQKIGYVVRLYLSNKTLTTPGGGAQIMDIETIPVSFKGATGATGTRTAVLDMYKWSATAPTTFPSGTSTYTWSTAQFTAPATTNGWTLTPGNGTAGQYLYICRQVYVDNTTNTTSTVTWSQTSSMTVGGLGSNGVNGTRTAVLDMYKWSATTPTTFPSGSSTYTWATGQFTAPATTNGWSLTPPAAVLGQTLYIARTVYADSDTTATSSVTWNTTSATVLSSSGSNGSRTAVLEMYKWSATTPTTFPSGSSTYTWATGAFTTPSTTNSWSLTPGAAVLGQTLWGCSVTYSDTDTTATSLVTWNTGTAYAVGAAGSNGNRTAVLEMYKWSATTPTTFPSGSSTYTWATGAFTTPSTTNSWSLTPPAPVSGQTLWGCSVIYSDTDTTATSLVTWNTSTAYAVGAAGQDGTSGLDGISINNTNPTYSALSLYDGTISSTTGSGTTIRVLEGETALTYSDTVIGYIAPSVVSSIGTNFGSATSGTVLLPSGLQTGDVIYVYVGSDGGSNVNTSTTGWTRLYNRTQVDAYGFLFKATYSPTLTAPSLTGMATATVALAVGIRNAGDATYQITSGSGVCPNPALITTTTPNSLVVVFGGIDDVSVAPVTAPTYYTSLLDGTNTQVTSSTTRHTVMGAYRVIDVVGDTDPGPFTTSNLTNDNVIAITIAIASANIGIVDNTPGTYGIAASYSPNATSPLTLGSITGSGTTTAIIADHTANPSSTSIDLYSITYDIYGTRLDGTTTFTRSTSQQINKTKEGSSGVSSLTASITGGNRTFLYDQYGLNPSPSSAGTFGVSVYYGSTLVTSNLTYTWSTTGIFTGSQGPSTTATFTPGLDPDVAPIPASSLTCEVRYDTTGLGDYVYTTATIPISAAQSGPRAPVQAYSDSRTWTDAEANAAILSLTGGTPIFGDRVTIYTEPKWAPIKGTYSASVVYFKNDIVIYNTSLYVVTVDSVVGVLPTVTSSWSIYSASFSNRGTWNYDTSYSLNNVVTFSRYFTTFSPQALSIVSTFAVINGNDTSDYMSYTVSSPGLSPGDAVILSNISGTTEFLANTIYYVVSCEGGRLQLSTTASPLTPINITDATFTLYVNKINVQQYVCISANTLSSTGVVATDEENVYRDFAEGGSITKYYASGVWTEVAAFFDGNVIVTGTLSVDTLKSGSARVGNTRGTFGLGGNEVLFGRKATARFTADNIGSIPLFTVNTRTSTTEWCHGQISGTMADNGYAYVGYSAKNNYGNYSTLFGGGFSTHAIVARKMLEGNIKGAYQLLPENLGQAQTDTSVALDGYGQVTRFYVEYTKVFNTSELSLTTGSPTITVTNHGLSVNQYIKFSSFTSGTNFKADTDYWVRSTPTANTITIYPVNSSVGTAAIIVDGSEFTTVKAYVKERPIRNVTFVVGSSTITSSGNHNLYPDELIEFTNVIYGVNFSQETYRVKDTPTATTFTVYKWKDTTKTAVTFDGTATSTAVVYAGNPKRSEAILTTSTAAGIFSLYSNNQIDLAAETRISAYVGATNYSLYSDAPVYAAGGTLPFTGKHVGVFDTLEEVELGDIVVDTELKIRRDISNAILKFTKSTAINQKSVIGVISDMQSSAPQKIIGYNTIVGQEEYTRKTDIIPIYGDVYDCTENEKFVIINALGEGLINVCGLNGDLEIGDLIVSSSIPGKGMKQDDDIVRNYTVAKSRENVSFDYPEQIKQIACIYLAG